jgi:F0F1-type ATP synthase membrane subunit c/vacuolar-type H+-ATPase subunit K
MEVLPAGPGAAVFQAGLAACLGELAGAIAGSVIGEHGFEAHAEARSATGRHSVKTRML